MKALLIIVHGSRRSRSNEEVKQLAGQLNTTLGETFPIIECGFLEIAEPAIGQAVDHCVAQGASEIRVLPYFLSAGRHVSEDVPAEINEAAKRHPDITLSIAPHIGASSLMVQVIKECTLNTFQS